MGNSWAVMLHQIICNYSRNKTRKSIKISKYDLFLVPGCLMLMNLIAYFIIRQSGKKCSSVNDLYRSTKPQNCATDRVLRIRSSKLRQSQSFLQWE